MTNADNDKHNTQGKAEICEYCDAPLVEDCNEFGSIFKAEEGLEYPCPNNQNQFPPRKPSSPPR